MANSRHMEESCLDVDRLSILRALAFGAAYCDVQLSDVLTFTAEESCLDVDHPSIWLLALQIGTCTIRICPHLRGRAAVTTVGSQREPPSLSLRSSIILLPGSSEVGSKCRIFFQIVVGSTAKEEINVTNRSRPVGPGDGLP